MIIVESVLTTFEASNVFEAAWAVVKIGSSLKPYPKSKFNQVELDTHSMKLAMFWTTTSKFGYGQVGLYILHSLFASAIFQ